MGGGGSNNSQKRVTYYLNDLLLQRKRISEKGFPCRRVSELLRMQQLQMY